MVTFGFDYSEVDSLAQIISNYGTNGIRTINEVLHSEAGQYIRDEIQTLLPVSGRTWSGKRAAASSTKPFKDDTHEMLAVTVKSKPAYNYLYFPDDGSNTKRHFGNKQFMKQGAEKAADKIINTCIGKLTEAL